MEFIAGLVSRNGDFFRPLGRGAAEQRRRSDRVRGRSRRRGGPRLAAVGCRIRWEACLSWSRGSGYAAGVALAVSFSDTWYIIISEDYTNCRGDSVGSTPEICMNKEKLTFKSAFVQDGQIYATDQTWGLGLRDLSLFNTATLAKRGWGFLTTGSALWVLVVRGKYGERTDSSLTLSLKSTDSWQWKGIAKAWNRVAGGASWSVRNGNTVRFWEDRWLRGGEPLIRIATSMVDALAVGSRVKEYVSTDTGGWDWSRLEHMLDYTTLLKVAAHRPPAPELGDNNICWALEPSGAFSVKTAYAMLAEPQWNAEDSIWRYVWGWNRGLFAQDFVRQTEESKHIQVVASGFECANTSRTSCVKPRKEWRWVRWRRPPPGWIKVNTDGASRGNPGLAGAGGLICGDDGRWICGFVHNVGFATSTIAKLWGALVGLELAWDRGYRYVVLELDSQVVQRLLSNQPPTNSYLDPLVNNINNILYRDWHVEVSHTYQESNMCADWMARWATSFSLGSYFFVATPIGINALLEGNFVGASISRLCVV
ncbi:hypothetical protein CRG98_040530 [Punica granatum]|uniref:RNase H type-1 domain-containing protein n=1 Tax=Punica granatum TaxID=22663 RepID=A0A2I0I6R1_PUNGR|nr:hypothetical protein CRG98_040530 [Punica granatum]